MTAKHAGQEVKQKAYQVSESAKEQIAEATDENKGMLSDRIDSLSKAVRSASSSLRNNNQGMVAEYTDKLAERIEEFNVSIKNKHPNEIYDSIVDMGRRNPLAFFSIAATIGFVLARSVKAVGSSYVERHPDYKERLKGASERTLHKVEDEVEAGIDTHPAEEKIKKAADEVKRRTS